MSRRELSWSGDFLILDRGSWRRHSHPHSLRVNGVRRGGGEANAQAFVVDQQTLNIRCSIGAGSNSLRTMCLGDAGGIGSILLLMSPGSVSASSSGELELCRFSNRLVCAPSQLSSPLTYRKHRRIALSRRQR